MKAWIVSMSGVAAWFVLSGVVHADDATPPGDASDERLERVMSRFHRADVNGDGKLTRDEARRGMPRIYQHFAEIDTENKGYITLAQVTSYLDAHPEAARSRNTQP